MATHRQRSNGTWEFCFQRKGVLPKKVYVTFDTLEAGLRYAEGAEEALSRGVVPPELGDGQWDTLQDLFDAYERSGVSTKSDAEMFRVVGPLIGERKLIAVNYGWVEEWAVGLSKKHAPSTTKKRVEFLGRALAWGMRKEKLTLLNNPVKQLPKGWATKEVANEKLWAGERDRRLESTEEGAIRKTLQKEEGLLFDMALETAMRMSEMYSLEVGQIDLAARTIFLDKSKNGSKRQVPISSVLLPLLTEALAGRSPEELLFSFWNGKEPRKAATNRLSHLFATRFEKAKCGDLRFHDLRHEATSRLFERTTMTDIEIATITGHRDPRMLKRYANLRGSTLAMKMW